jgi:hypothetical protein
MKFSGDEAFLSSSVQDELTYEQPTGELCIDLSSKPAATKWEKL